MAVARISLAAVTQADRHLVTDAAREAVSRAGGWIEDVQFFGNLSLALRAMLPAGGLAVFGDNLMAAGAIFDADAERALATAAAMAPEREIACTVQISFFHREPDLRRDVPAVPG